MASNIYRAVSATAQFDKIAENVTSPSALINQPLGVSYYKVSNVNISGEGTLSDPVQQIVVGKPVVPSATNGVGTVTLNIPLPSYASGIVVEESTNNVTWTKVTETNQSTFALASFSGTKYFRTYGIASNSQSAYSDVFTYVQPVLTAPTITATQSGSDAILMWTAVPGALAYEVYRNGVLVATTTALTHTEANAISSITFTVFAIAGFVRVSWYVVYVPIIPIPPTNFTAMQSALNIVLNWTPPPGLTPSSYQLWYRVDGSTWTMIDISGTANNYTLTPAASGLHEFNIYTVYQGWRSEVAISNPVQFTQSITYSGNYDSDIVYPSGNVLWEGNTPTGFNKVRIWGEHTANPAMEPLSGEIRFNIDNTGVMTWSLIDDGTSYLFDTILDMYAHRQGKPAKLFLNIWNGGQGRILIKWNIEFYNA